MKSIFDERHIPKDLLEDYTEGILPEETEEQIELHTQNCEACMAALKAIELVKYQALFEEEVNPKLAAEERLNQARADFLQKIEKNSVKPKLIPDENRPIRFSWRRFGRVAAILLILAVSTILLWIGPIKELRIAKQIALEKEAIRNEVTTSRGVIVGPNVEVWQKFWENREFEKADSVLSIQILPLKLDTLDIESMEKIQRNKLMYFAKGKYLKDPPDIELAAEYFQFLLKSNDSDQNEPAQWYLSLIMAEKGRRKESISILKEIKTIPLHQYRKEADTLLSLLE